VTPFLPAIHTFPACPHCGSAAEPLPIVYGYPTHEAFEAEQRGELVIGGCLIGDESPDYQCRDCRAALPWIAPSQPEEDD
jgi:hypothetical protein